VLRTDQAGESSFPNSWRRLARRVVRHDVDFAARTVHSRSRALLYAPWLFCFFDLSLGSGLCVIAVKVIDGFNQPGGVIFGREANPCRRDPDEPKQQQKNVGAQGEPQSVLDAVLVVNRRADEHTANQAAEDARRQAVGPEPQQVAAVPIANQLAKNERKAFLIARAVAQVH